MRIIKKLKKSFRKNRIDLREINYNCYFWAVFVLTGHLFFVNEKVNFYGNVGIFSGNPQSEGKTTEEELLFKLDSDIAVLRSKYEFKKGTKWYVYHLPHSDNNESNYHFVVESDNCFSHKPNYFEPPKRIDGLFDVRMEGYKLVKIYEFN